MGQKYGDGVTERESERAAREERVTTRRENKDVRSHGWMTTRGGKKEANLKEGGILTRHNLSLIHI